MITINSIEDLEKYKTKVMPKHRRDPKRVVMYEFKENGEKADVIFNIEIAFGFSDLSTPLKVHLLKESQGKEIPDDIKKLNVPIVYDAEDDFILPDIEFSEPDCYCFVANSIVANKKFRVGRLYSNFAELKDDSEVYDILRVKTKIVAKKLNCDMVEIMCGEMICDDLICDNIFCGKLQAKSLITKHNQFENITAENVNMFYELIKD